MTRWILVLPALAATTLPALGFALPLYTDASGREWLDLNATRNRSWADAAASCDALSGFCAGILAATDPFTADVDLTGFQWASRDDVRNLFYEIGGLPSGSLDSYAASFPTALGYGNNVFDLFEPTIQFSAGPGVDNVLNGLTRDTFIDPVFGLLAHTGLVYDSSYGNDNFTLTGGFGTTVRDVSIGAYVYRRPHSVPEPGTLALFAAAAAGMVLGLRRRSQAATAD